MRKRLVASLLALALVATTPFAAFAAGNGSDDNYWYYDTVTNAGKNDGYIYDNPIRKDDPHYGWSLGRFVVSGFTERKGDDDPVFLKNVGDEVKLSFELQQDLNALDGDDSKRIVIDKDGYDENYQVKKTDFGRGTLIVRQTDYQNESSDPKLYINYLDGVEKGSETEVVLFEEGDYEVSLNYVIESEGFPSFITKQTDYHIHFKFRVRNSNTMAFLFDTSTGAELFNGQVTENGFRIDTAGSHYLSIHVKKEVLNDARDGLVEDTRFNVSATDGSQFTDPGVYTVTVSNSESGEERTTKQIYVGNDDLLKASVANGMSVSDVQEKLEEGATVAEDGTLVLASVTNDGETPEASEEERSTPSDDVAGFQGPLLFGVRPIFVALLVLAVIFAIIRARLGRSKR